MSHEISPFYLWQNESYHLKVAKNIYRLIYRLVKGFFLFLSGSLPKSGPFIFASENQFLWNLAHQKGFVHN